MNNTLKLEEGKTYILRNGTIPTDSNGRLCKVEKFIADYPVEFFKWQYANDTYMDNGKRLGCGESQYDIVAEYVPPAEEKPEAPADAKTLRDEFAVVAMNALMLKVTFNQNMEIIPVVASASYEMADAMMEARKARS